MIFQANVNCICTQITKAKVAFIFLTVRYSQMALCTCCNTCQCFSVMDGWTDVALQACYSSWGEITCLGVRLNLVECKKNYIQTFKNQKIIIAWLLHFFIFWAMWKWESIEKKSLLEGPPSGKAYLLHCKMLLSYVPTGGNISALSS